MSPFLGHNQDNNLFQDKSVIEIVDELLSNWKTQGKLVPEWRWNLTDTAAYPKRGMTVQYRESDPAFLKRLLAEEGLFCWFAHESAEDDSIGKLTPIIADLVPQEVLFGDNGAFMDNVHPRIRFNLAESMLNGVEGLLAGATDIPSVNWKKSPKPESSDTPAEPVEFYRNQRDVSR